MENDKNIALFIDLDNCNINTMYFDNAIEELKIRGNIVTLFFSFTCIVTATSLDCIRVCAATADHQVFEL